MATRKASGKKVAPRKPSNKKPKRGGALADCGGFTMKPKGKKLTLTFAAGTYFDLEVNLSNDECRSSIQCRIVNGQLEC